MLTNGIVVLRQWSGGILAEAPLGSTSETGGVHQAREVVDVDPAASTVDHAQRMPAREDAREQIAEARRAERAVCSRLADGLHEPARPLAAQMQEADPDAVAAGGRHLVADLGDPDLLEAEAPRVGVIGEDSVGRDSP